MIFNESFKEKIKKCGLLSTNFEKYKILSPLETYIYIF